MTERELYHLNFMNALSGVVEGALGDSRDSDLARRLGMSEWRVRVVRYHPMDWTIENVSHLLLAVGAELELNFKEPPREAG